MSTWTGHLEYLGWLETWTVDAADVREPMISFLTNAAASDARFDDQIMFEGYRVKQMADGPHRLVYDGDGIKPDGATSNALLVSASGSFKLRNVTSYIETAMMRLNGRVVTLQIDGDGFSLVGCDDEVHAVDRRPGTNSGMVDEQSIRPVCRIGQGRDCCIFLTCKAIGFCCEKFSPVGRLLLDRHAKGSMAAGRIGNCRLRSTAPTATAAP